MVRAKAEALFEEEEYLPVVLIDCVSPSIEEEVCQNVLPNYGTNVFVGNKLFDVLPYLQELTFEVARIYGKGFVLLTHLGVSTFGLRNLIIIVSGKRRKQRGRKHRSSKLSNSY